MGGTKVEGEPDLKAGLQTMGYCFFWLVTLKVAWWLRKVYENCDLKLEYGTF